MSALRYFRIHEVPGNYFVCPSYQAVLSTTACSKLYSEAKYAHEARHPTCRGCAIGAKHAHDAQPADGAGIYGSMLCARCHRPGSRLLYGALCISCTNRQLERIRGRNGKGRFPIHAPATVRQSCRVITKDALHVYTFLHTTDTIETVFRVLHLQPDFVMFARMQHGLPLDGLPSAVLYRETIAPR